MSLDEVSQVSIMLWSIPLTFLTVSALVLILLILHRRCHRRALFWGAVIVAFCPILITLLAYPYILSLDTVLKDTMGKHFLLLGTVTTFWAAALIVISLCYEKYSRGLGEDKQ